MNRLERETLDQNSYWPHLKMEGSASATVKKFDANAAKLTKRRDELAQICDETARRLRALRNFPNERIAEQQALEDKLRVNDQELENVQKQLSATRSAKQQIQDADAALKRASQTADIYKVKQNILKKLNRNTRNANPSDVLLERLWTDKKIDEQLDMQRRYADDQTQPVSEDVEKSRLEQKYGLVKTNQDVWSTTAVASSGMPLIGSRPSLTEVFAQFGVGSSSSSSSNFGLAPPPPLFELDLPDPPRPARSSARPAAACTSASRWRWVERTQ